MSALRGSGTRSHTPGTGQRGLHGAFPPARPRMGRLEEACVQATSTGEGRGRPTSPALHHGHVEETSHRLSARRQRGWSTTRPGELTRSTTCCDAARETSKHHSLSPRNHLATRPSLPQVNPAPTQRRRQQQIPNAGHLLQQKHLLREDTRAQADTQLCAPAAGGGEGWGRGVGEGHGA